MRFHRSAVLFHLTLALLVIVTLPPLATAQLTYDEDFTSTAHLDTATPSAAWDTTTGHSGLPAFTPSLLGAVDTPGILYRTTVRGDILIAADKTAVQLIDISDSANPTLLGSVPAENTNAVDVAGNLALAGNGFAGVLLVDITDTNNPTIVGSFDTASSASGVALAGDLAFLADQTNHRWAGRVVPDSAGAAGPAGQPGYTTARSQTSVLRGAGT